LERRLNHPEEQPETRPGPVAHYNVTLLMLNDRATLDALMVNPEIRSLIWTRLDETRALVDPDRLRLLRDRLRKLGITPRLSSPLS
jgi:hypothetical protein